MKLLLVGGAVALSALVGVDGQVPSFSCGDYNNDCLGCVQMSDNIVYQCSFCPKTQTCHTVGSLFNKCSSGECISFSAASQCKNREAADCSSMMKSIEQLSNDTKAD